MAFGQLEKPILIAPISTLFQRVASLGTELARFAAKLEEPTYKVSHYLPRDPPRDHLYIIVQALNAGKLLSGPNIDVAWPECRHVITCTQRIRRYLQRLHVNPE